MLYTSDNQPQRGLAVRLKLGTNVAARRWAPRPLVPSIVAARSWIGRRRPGRVETARESMRFLVGPGASHEEIERLAEGYLTRSTWRIETRWRPGLVNDQEVVGLDHLDEAHAHGKGVLLSFIHHGDYFGQFPSIARTGRSMVAIGSSGLFDPRGVLWQQQHMRAFTSVPGSDAMDVSIGSAGIRELFSQGRAVAIALDFPGHTPIHMFGQDLHLSSGGVRIAHGLGVPVVPVLAERVGTGLVGGARTVLGAPLLPAGFASPETLHAELARQFEKSILAWPEATEEPLRMAKSHLVRESSEYRQAG